MEVRILDASLRDLDAYDVLGSLIWTDRYSRCGDFEIYTPINDKVLAILQEDYYLWQDGSEHAMIIEGRTIKTDPEAGKFLTVSGRSLESILDRRIVWGLTILSGNLQNGIQKLLNENVINPVMTSRKIDNFIFEASTDPKITELTIEAQYNGDNLYDVVQTICDAMNIGFKVTLTDDGFFKFKLYSGVDRSYDQTTMPYVVFSPNFDNIRNTNYIESKRALKTATLVVGEGEGADQKTIAVELSSGETGLARREMLTDASGLSSNTDEGVLTDAEYYAQLAQKGGEDLANNIFVKSFEGEAETSQLYRYGEDFFMGDVVQIANEYGMEAKVRVVELIFSQDQSGLAIYPTFNNVN